MGGGIIQLVAYGAQDLFLTKDPQITFFKMIYRRHTNFATEIIPQFFAHTPDFGKRISVVIGRHGDLVRAMYLVIELPKIPTFNNKDDNHIGILSSFAWVRKIGYAIIKYVEIELGGELMDKQYGEWLYIWNELTTPNNKNIDKLIGDIPDLVNFTNGKNSYKLYIPLKFWFNRITGLALPLVNLQYNHVKINVCFNDLDKCYKTTPTHYINIQNDIVNFVFDEYIIQNLNGTTIVAKFVYFDIIHKRLYLHRITHNGFNYTSNTNDNVIIGLTTNFEAIPQVGALEHIHRFNNIDIKGISLKNSFLLVEYMYLDDEERAAFAKSKLEYLIEQIVFNGTKIINNTHHSFKIGLTHPCKELIWVSQLDSAEKNNDHFNYTNSLLYENGEYIGTNIIKKETIQFNSRDIISFRDYEYFNWVHPYQYHINGPPEGINIYSFTLYPEKHQPAGSVNLSRINDISLKLTLSPDINQNNTAKLRVYGVVYNILRISNGISGLVFSNDVQI